MQRDIVGGILYLIWLLLPVIVLYGLRALRFSTEVIARSTMAAAAFAIPGYLGLVCLVTGLAWPPDIFFPTPAPLSVSVPGYTVEYAQQWGQDFYETYFEVTREDGLKAYLEVDPDDNKCWSMATQQAGSKIYFLCDEKSPTERSSYLDTRWREIYAAGSSSCTQPLDGLVFRDYKTNPLVDRNVIMTEELANSLRCQPRSIPTDF